MNVNFIYILFYDIPSNKNKSNKPYREFRKKVLFLGGYQLQESVYLFDLATKAMASQINHELTIVVPKGANVRSLVVTAKQFATMNILAGKKNIGEKIMQNKNPIIEF